MSKESVVENQEATEAHLERRPRTKTVAPLQRAVDALPYGSGDWSVAGVPGLFLRCGARTKTYRLQRRVRGRLVWRVLGEMSLAQARRAAMTEWARLKPRAPQGRVTVAEAWRSYLDEKRLAPKTRFLYEYNLQKYLGGWKDRTLHDVGEDRAGLRRFFIELAKSRGLAVAKQVLGMVSAVYRYARKIAPDLPECPTEVVELPRVRPRDWALSDDELRQWWASVQRLRPLKRTFWQVVLLTAARRGSVEALRWRDVDFERGLIAFSTAKAGRTYSVPGCARLLELLRWWRKQAPPGSEWVFESPQKPGHHIVAARDDRRGVVSAHHLRHTYRTTLAQLGCPPDSARLLLGHSLTGDVSRGYITPGLVVESLRPWAEAVAAKYAGILNW